jgi:predicted TIM-barrel fold metal-dependent hydrolase
MVIDFHTHVFPDALAEKALGTLLDNIKDAFVPVTDATVSGLLKHMTVSGVDVCGVQPGITTQSQFVGLNEWAAGLASDRLVTFGGIYPHTDDYRRDIDYVAGLGLKGLKFHCEYQGFTVDEPKMLRIYDYALSRGLILLHHAGFDPGYGPTFRSSPQRFARVVDAMKGGVVVAAHFGGHAEWDDVERCLVGKDIYLDTSMGFEYFPQEQFLRIVVSHVAEKILLASDSPWSDAGTELERLRALPLPERERDLITGGNAQRLLGL